MDETPLLVDESLGVTVGAGTGEDLRPVESETDAVPMTAEDVTLGMALLVKAALSFIARRRGWAPPEDDEIQDIAPPSARLALYFFPWLKDVPVLVDAVAAGSGIAGFYARREGTGNPPKTDERSATHGRDTQGAAPGPEAGGTPPGGLDGRFGKPTL